MHSEALNHCNDRSDWRQVWLVAAVLLLPLNAFPLGINLLREFGARPTNFIIALAAAAMLPLLLLKLDRPFRLRRFDLIVATLLTWIVVDSGIIIATKGLPDTSAFLKQIMMLLFSIASIYMWLGIFSGDFNRTFSVVAKLISMLTAVFVLAFLGEYFHLFECQSALLEIIVRREECYRPAGLFSEPSYFGAWIGFSLPFLRFVLRRWFPIALLLLVGVVLMSGARTFFVILAMQALALVTVNRFVLIAGFVGLSAAQLLVTFIFGFVDDPSAINRSLATISSLFVFADHPLSGIGAGQFTHYFVSGLAGFFQVDNPEYLRWMSGDAEERLSTFNYFSRIAAEYGVIGIGAIVFMLLDLMKSKLPGTQSPLSRQERRFLNLVLFSGITFMLTQDTYSFQPGLLSIALVVHYIRTKAEGASTRGAH